MNWKRITLITATESVNASFFFSSLSLQSFGLFLCGKLMTCTKPSQSTQTLICQILKSPDTCSAPTRLTFGCTNYTQLLKFNLFCFAGKSPSWEIHLLLPSMFYTDK